MRCAVSRKYKQGLQHHNYIAADWPWGFEETTDGLLSAGTLGIGADASRMPLLKSKAFTTGLEVG